MNFNVRRPTVTMPVSSCGYVIRLKNVVVGRNLFERYGLQHRLTGDVPCEKICIE